MIGDLTRGCMDGRRDARRGHRASMGNANAYERAYVEAWGRERNAMRKRGQLPQLEMPLDATPPRAENRCEADSL